MFHDVPHVVDDLMVDEQLRREEPHVVPPLDEPVCEGGQRADVVPVHPGIVLRVIRVVEHRHGVDAHDATLGPGDRAVGSVNRQAEGEIGHHCKLSHDAESHDAPPRVVVPEGAVARQP